MNQDSDNVGVKHKKYKNILFFENFLNKLRHFIKCVLSFSAALNDRKIDRLTKYINFNFSKL